MLLHVRGVPVMYFKVKFAQCSETILSQLDKISKIQVYSGDKNDCTLHEITHRNAVHFRYLSSWEQLP